MGLIQTYVPPLFKPVYPSFDGNDLYAEYCLRAYPGDPGLQDVTGNYPGVRRPGTRFKPALENTGGLAIDCIGGSGNSQGFYGGDGTFVDILGGSWPDTSTSWAIGTWVWFTNTTRGWFIGDVPASGSGNTIYLEVNGGTFQWVVGSRSVAHPTRPGIGVPFHTFVGWDVGAQRMRLFQDGRFVNSITLVPTRLDGDRFAIGSGGAYTQLEGYGGIWDTRIYQNPDGPMDLYALAEHLYAPDTRYALYGPEYRDIPVGIPGVAPGGNPTISLNQGLSTVIDATEAEIAAGGTSAFIEITDGSFKPQGLMTTAERQQIVAGCQDISTEANRVEWDKVIAATQAVADANVVVLPGEATVAIQFAPAPTYNIATDAEIRFIAPTALYTATP